MSKFINRKDDSISLYFKDIKPYDLVNAEEELALAKRIKDHDDEIATEKLVMANLRFVISGLNNLFCSLCMRTQGL